MVDLETLLIKTNKFGKGIKTNLDKFIEWAKNYRSEKKVNADQTIDKLMFIIGANAGYLLTANQIINSIDNPDINKKLITAGTYILTGIGLSPLNQKIILPIANKIKEYHKGREEKGEKSKIGSWGRTVAQIGLIAAMIGGFNLENHDIKDYQQPNTVQEQTINSKKKTKHVNNKLETIKTGSLEGRILGGHYAAYIGVNGKVPAEIEINFSKKLEERWNVKKNRYPGKWVFNTAGERLIEEYKINKPTKMNLEQYIKIHDKILKDINKKIDWNKVKKLTYMNNKTERFDLLKDIANSITGKDLITYGLTELMPSKTDGNLNKEFLDFLLQNAGREFIESVPATGDKKTSFGLYQFTEYAVYDSKGIRRGASIINHALPEDMRIPGSVMNLRGDDHIKAAYMFGIYNLSTMINSLLDTQFEVLKNTWEREHKKEDIIQYIATAHHSPANAKYAAQCWLDNDAKYDYSVSCNNRIKNYALKTSTNYKALNKLN